MRSVLFLSISFLANLGFSQPGSLDATFGTGGIVQINLGPGGDGGQDVIALPDGKILLCGNTDMNGPEQGFIMRLLPDGSEDPGYGTVLLDGITNAQVFRMAIAADSSIYLCGKANPGSYDTFGLWHILSDGSLDTNFGTNGLVTTQVGFTNTRAQDLAIQNDGKIVVVGFENSTSAGNGIIMRHHANGILDSTFSSDGIKELTNFPNERDQLRSVDLLNDGSIVASGDATINGDETTFLVKLQSNGNFDNSFGVGGVFIPTFFGYPDSRGWSLAAYGQQIIAAGSAGSGTQSSDVYALRVDENAVYDASFGTNGRAYIDAFDDDFVYDVKVQSDGKVICTGYTGNNANLNIEFFTVRYLIDGTPDPNFGNNGIVVTSTSTQANAAAGLTIQGDGKVICTGFSGLSDTEVTLVRYCGDLSTGLTDLSTSNNLLIYPNPTTNLLNIKCSHPILSIALYDLLGRELPIETARSSNLNVSKLEQGNYRILVNTTRGVLSQMFSKE